MYFRKYPGYSLKMPRPTAFGSFKVNPWILQVCNLTSPVTLMYLTVWRPLHYLKPLSICICLFGKVLYHFQRIFFIFKELIGKQSSFLIFRWENKTQGVLMTCFRSHLLFTSFFSAWWLNLLEIILPSQSLQDRVKQLYELLAHSTICFW